MLGGVLAIGDATPAAACSCAGPPKLAIEFTGEAIASNGPATWGKVWRFRTTAAGRSVDANEIVEVAIDGQDPPDANGLQAVSSCSIGPYPVSGGIYEVGAYGGTNPDNSPRYFATGCGGYVREVAAPATGNASNGSVLTPAPVPQDPGRDTPAALLIVAAAAVVATAGASYLLRGRISRPAGPLAKR